jgi:hypothetical protein
MYETPHNFAFFFLSPLFCHANSCNVTSQSPPNEMKGFCAITVYDKEEMQKAKTNNKASDDGKMPIAQTRGPDQILAFIIAA